MAFNHSPQIVKDNLVLYLDAGSPKSYGGSGTTWTDISRNGNNGTLVNGVSYSNGAMVFDGVNDYVNCGSNLLIGRPCSIGCWVRFNSIVGWQTIAGQDTSQATLLGSFYFQKVNNSGETSGRTFNTFGIAFTNTSGNPIFCYDSQPVQTGIWYNYYITMTTTSIAVYRNGILVNTTNNSDSMATSSGVLYVGAGYYNETIVDYANCNLESFQIYNRALSQAEILQNYNATKGRYGL